MLLVSDYYFMSAPRSAEFEYKSDNQRGAELSEFGRKAKSHQFTVCSLSSSSSTLVCLCSTRCYLFLSSYRCSGDVGEIAHRSQACANLYIYGRPFFVPHMRSVIALRGIHIGHSYGTQASCAICACGLDYNRRVLTISKFVLSTWATHSSP